MVNMDVFPGKSSRGVALATHSHLAWSNATPLLPHCLHGMLRGDLYVYTPVIIQVSQQLYFELIDAHNGGIITRNILGGIK
jgi:hypothetical protein